MAVEPVPGEPAAVADLPSGRALVVADYHAGLEAGLRAEGVELESAAADRRQHLVELLDRTGVAELVVLGDLTHAIGDPWDEEREEVEALLAAIDVPTTLVKGNHDGEVDSLVADTDVTVTDTAGVRRGPVGFAHGHTWPSPAVLGADVVCVGHEHPMVRLEDEVGGTRAERAWLRGSLAADAFRDYYDEPLDVDGELVVCPAFNDRTGGTWVNVAGQSFLAPFLPAGLADGEAYLLDGTRLGPYRDV